MKLTPHAVYTAYDAKGAPLYVGCTKNPHRRMHDHRFNGVWFDAATKVTLTWLPTKATGMAFEKKRIEALRPVHNTQHNTPDPVLTPPIQIRPEDRLTKMVSTRITEADHARLVAAAGAADVTLSHYLARLLMADLDHVQEQAA